MRLATVTDASQARERALLGRLPYDYLNYAPRSPLMLAIARRVRVAAWRDGVLAPDLAVPAMRHALPAARASELRRCGLVGVRMRPMLRFRCPTAGFVTSHPLPDLRTTSRRSPLAMGLSSREVGATVAPGSDTTRRMLMAGRSSSASRSRFWDALIVAGAHVGRVPSSGGD